MTETELVAAIQAKDTAALEKIIQQYSGYVMAVVQHTLGKNAAEEDKEEVVSDVFVALWKNAAGLKPDTKLKAWLAVVARNKAINKMRTIHQLEELQEDTIGDGSATVTSPIEKQQQASLVRQAVDSLDPKARNLFLRHYFWHQSIGAIAEETGLNPSTIKSHLYRGRQKLKTALQQKGCTL